jgi:hypothetical protein
MLNANVTQVKLLDVATWMVSKQSSLETASGRADAYYYNVLPFIRGVRDHGMAAKYYRAFRVGEIASL